MGKADAAYRRLFEHPAMLRDLRECVEQGEHAVAVTPQVFGDVGDGGASQRGPPSAPPDAGHPVAQEVLGQESGMPELGTGEASQ